MIDENLITALEQSLRLTRNAQARLMSRLREVEDESERLREEIQALENAATQTEAGIDSVLMSIRPGHRKMNLGKLGDAKIEYEQPTNRFAEDHPLVEDRSTTSSSASSTYRPNNPVAYMNVPSRGVPSINTNIRPISNRFADRTITQACTLLLREAGKPLHVNELYNFLVSGGMEFKGNNPTISIAVSLNRNRRFRKVEPGTFDLMMREASQAAS